MPEMMGCDMIEYGFVKELDADFESTVDAVKDALREEGFGILMAIDVREKLQEKLGIDFEKYVILGACDPASAHKALMVEENVGLMLPCNVIVYEKAEGKTVVGTIRPSAMMSMVGNAALSEIAVEVEEKIKRVLDTI